MYNDGGSPTLIDCTFYQNLAEEAGGGMYNNTDANPQLIRCTFTENFAVGFWGGGMSNGTGQPTLTECLFIHNGAREGGAIDNSVGTPTIDNCSFLNNYANRGGAISNGGGSNCKIWNSTFISNFVSFQNPGRAAGTGGAIWNYYSSPEVIGCEFVNNRAGYAGGAMMNEQYANPRVLNCTIYANESREGGGIFSRSHSNPVISNCILSGNSAWEIGGGISWDLSEEPNDITNCTFLGNTAPVGPAVAFNGYKNEYTLANCIVRGSDEVSPLWYDTNNTSLTVSHSNVQGGWPGKGNIDADPCLVDPGYWDPNGTLEDANDDFWVDGDYHLKSQAGRWDPASKSWVRDDITSPCIDAGDPITPIGHEPFPNAGVINMGAYGGAPEASKSYFNAPVCQTIIAGDINGDCVVDFRDFAIMALHWLEQN